jgi:hypothetical protein
VIAEQGLNAVSDGDRTVMVSGEKYHTLQERSLEDIIIFCVCNKDLEILLGKGAFECNNSK